MTLGKAIKHYENFAIKHNAEVEAIKWLIMELLEYTATEIYLKQDEMLNDEQVALIDLNVKKYVLDKIPVQHLLGYAYFYGYKFGVNQDVLIPRRETEELVENILIYYDKYFAQKLVDVIDLGTGSGCIGITLAKEEANLVVIAADVSDKALVIAKENAYRLNVNVELIESNWWKNVKGEFDILVANPPYIPNGEAIGNTVDKEPEVALYGGDSGLVYYEEILKGAKQHLKSQALIGFEHGYQHNEELMNLINQYFPESIVIQKKDLQGLDRFTFIGIGGVLNDE